MRDRLYQRPDERTEMRQRDDEGEHLGEQFKDDEAGKGSEEGITLRATAWQEGRESKDSQGCCCSKRLYQYFQMKTKTHSNYSDCSC